MATSVLNGLAQSFASLQFVDLPTEVISCAKCCALDAIGNILSGKNSLKVQKAKSASGVYVDATNNMMGDNAITKIAREQTSFIMSIMARTNDLDDGHSIAMGHPGSVIVPTLLAQSCSGSNSGKDFLLALIVGYEIYARIGSVMFPNAYVKLGFESTGICGAIAAAAAIAKLKQDEVNLLKNSIGIAATFASGLIEYQNDGSDGKYLCPALASLRGFEAVTLAEAGFTGAEYIFEGKQGLFQSHGANSHVLCEDICTLKEYKILDTYFKLHACMRGLHPSVDAAIAVRRKIRSVSDVSAVIVKTSPFVKRLDKAYPHTLQEAQSNISFVVCVALLTGNISISSLKENLDNPEVYALFERTQIVIDEDVCTYVNNSPHHWGASKVCICMTDGQTYEQWESIARGDKSSPLSTEELVRKFKILSKDVMTDHESTVFAEMILNLETISDVSILINNIKL